MKKLMIALCLAGSLCAFSQEGGPKPEGGDRPKMSQEQRQAMRAKMAARREAAQAKILTILKDAGLEEAKAKDVMAQIEKVYMEGRPQRPAGAGARGRRPGGRKGPAPEAK